MLLLSMPLSARAALVMEVTGTSSTCEVIPSSVKALSVTYWAFFMSAGVNESMSTIITPPLLRNLMFCFSAAGFMARSTSQVSPGV